MKRKLVIRVSAAVLAVSLTGCGVAPASPSASEVTTESISSSQSTPAVTNSTESSPDQKATEATIEAAEEATTKATDALTEATEEPTTEATEEATTEATEEVATEATKEAPTEPTTEVFIEETDETLEQSQLNSIAWLNYLAALSQKINASKHSRLFLEEAYASLINNTNPENVNDLTQSHLASLLDTIENYRMIDVKRERLQYIYEQNKAKALKASMPNPIGLLSAVNSFDVKKLVVSVVYMAVDSASSYKAYNASINQEFLMDGWELDDEEAQELHTSRKLAFNYMVDIVQQEHIPGELALSEKNIEDFVSCIENPNVFQRIQFLETEYDTYHAFGDYWLALADCYYERNDYEKCLDAAHEYEKLQTGIFRKDYYWARTLPKIIVAARETYTPDQYVEEAARYLSMIEENTERSEWALRYFAAEIYTDLYAKTNDNTYLRKAYNLVVNNINELVAEQKELNQVYLAEVKEVQYPKEAVRAEKKKIDKYNDSLHEQRETELPPVYEPLVVNLDFLFALMEEMPISNFERQRIDGILHGDGDLFLSDAVEMMYSFEKNEANYDGIFERKSLSIPVSAVNPESYIRVKVRSQDSEYIYTDWDVKEVTRDGEAFSDYTVTYISEEIKDQKWDENCKVDIEIFSSKDQKNPYATLHFKVSKCTAWGKYVTFEQVR